MMTRREICSRLLQLLVAGGFFHVTWKYIRGTIAPSLEVSFSEQPLEGDVMYRHGVYLVGLHEGVKALSARCPHLGCHLAYHATSRRFQCPCHGSYFSLKGRRLGGPTKKDMTVLNLCSYDKWGACKVTLPFS